MIETETYDLWRKSVQPNLLANRPWSIGAANDSRALRIKLVMEVLNVSFEGDDLVHSSAANALSGSRLIGAAWWSTIPGGRTPVSLPK